MFDKNSLHALNKNATTAIVYVDAYGATTRLTADDFSSLKEFRKWKNWTKMKAHSDEKKEHIYRNHTCGLETVPDECTAVASRETELVEAIDREEWQKMIPLLTVALEECLTETQLQRLHMHFFEGLSTREIAEQLGVSHVSVYQSIEGAKKKLKIFLTEGH